MQSSEFEDESSLRKEKKKKRKSREQEKKTDELNIKKLQERQINRKRFINLIK